MLRFKHKVETLNLIPKIHSRSVLDHFLLILESILLNKYKYLNASNKKSQARSTYKYLQEDKRTNLGK